MRSFFLHRDYPPAVVDRAPQRVNAISREAAMRPPEDDSNKQIIPLILTFNPINGIALGAFRRDTNLKDSLVRSNLQTGVNTEDDSVWNLALSSSTMQDLRPYTNPAVQINTPGGPLTVRQRFMITCMTSNVVYIILLFAVHVLCLTAAKLDAD